MTFWWSLIPAQVTLIISGAHGPPAPSFADFADAVQQEFDVWWAQELQEAQSPREVFKPENILASNLTSEDDACGSLRLVSSCFGWESKTFAPSNSFLHAGWIAKALWLRNLRSSSRLLQLMLLAFCGLTITPLCKNGCPGAAMPLYGTLIPACVSKNSS